MVKCEQEDLKSHALEFGCPCSASVLPHDFAYGEVNPSWRQIDFRVYYKDGSVVDVEALRPQSWIDSRGFKVGSRIDLNLPERPLLGRATVTAIGDCPCIDIGDKNDGELVITTYRTLHRVPILKVLLENGESIQGTVDHRIWSASESAWKQLQELEPGESVQTRFGDLKVRSSQLQSTRQRVYNFEVQGQHVYEISDSGILVHNTGGCEKFAEEIARRKALAPSRGLWNLTTDAASAVKQHGKFGKFYKSKSDGLWWAVDNAGHGESSFKVFKETGKGLEWIADADKYGDFITGKHKGPTGLFIPWKSLKGK